MALRLEGEKRRPLPLIWWRHSAVSGDWRSDLAPSAESAPKVVPCLPAAKHRGLAAVFSAEEREGFSAFCAHQSTFKVRSDADLKLSHECYQMHSVMQFLQDIWHIAISIKMQIKKNWNSYPPFFFKVKLGRPVTAPGKDRSTVRMVNILIPLVIALPNIWSYLLWEWKGAHNYSQTSI